MERKRDSLAEEMNEERSAKGEGYHRVREHSFAGYLITRFPTCSPLEKERVPH